MNYVNVSLTSAVDLKVIPLCVNKTGKVTVKVHLSQTDYPEVTQVSGMFNLHQAGTQRATSVTLLAAPHIYFDVKSFFARGNVIRRRCADAVFVCFFCCCFFTPDGLKYLEEMKFIKCIYIEDTCLERLSSIESLQETLNRMEVVSCGNVTDKGLIALHRLR